MKLSVFLKKFFLYTEIDILIKVVVFIHDFVVCILVVVVVFFSFVFVAHLKDKCKHLKSGSDLK